VLKVHGAQVADIVAELFNGRADIRGKGGWGEDSKSAGLKTDWKYISL